MMRAVSTILLLLIFRCAAAEGEKYIYRIWLADKGRNCYSTERPEEFLSAKALERRAKQGIAITEEDLPPSEHYITEILKYGGKAICRSRWLNTVLVASNSARLAAKLGKLPFVKETELIYEKRKKTTGLAPVLQYGSIDSLPQPDSVYGYSRQAEILNGTPLHTQGYRGKGITIAVLDAGFADIGDMPEQIDASRIKGYYDAVMDGGDMDGGHVHGTAVLSVMLADKRGELSGCAPEADYMLIRTEYFGNEYRQEEDFWVRGAEYADSIGADIITSSLGYTRFDATSRQYWASDRDGNTAVISRGAAAAARKGIAVIVGAGNNGHDGGSPLPFPSDADGITAVGSCNRDGRISAFSSGGYTCDGRVRPDIVAPGEEIAVTIDGGRLATASGTSYSTPAAAGLAACLMQAFPQCGTREIMQLIKESSSRYDAPEPPYGYGMPDFGVALLKAAERYGTPAAAVTEQ